MFTLSFTFNSFDRIKFFSKFNYIKIFKIIFQIFLYIIQFNQILLIKFLPFFFSKNSKK